VKIVIGYWELPVSCFVSRTSGMSCFLTALWKSGRFLNTGTVAMGRATGRVTLSILDVAESFLPCPKLILFILGFSSRKILKENVHLHPYKYSSIQSIQQVLAPDFFSLINLIMT
jgi:hypothetical protein